MFRERGFWLGAFVGIAGVWAYHHFMRPLPGAKGT